MSTGPYAQRVCRCAREHAPARIPPENKGKAGIKLLASEEGAIEDLRTYRKANGQDLARAVRLMTPKQHGYPELSGT